LLTDLFHEVGTDLADQGILIAGTAAATDRTNQLAVLDQLKSAGACDQRRVERSDVAVTAFKRIVE